MYEAPERLPEPYDLPPPSVLPVYVMALITTAALTLALFGAAQLGYVFVLYDIALGWALGHAVAIGIQWGEYPLSVVRVLLVSVLALFGGFHVAVYLESIWGVSGSYPNFFEFLLYRASQQTLVFAYRPGTWAMLALWLGEIGLTFYVAARIARRAAAAVRLHAVPMEVTEFVLYLLFQGKGAADVEAELAQRGWTERQDIVRAFDAADIAASLIDASRNTSSETPD